MDTNKISYASKPSDPDTVEGRLQTLARSATEILGKATVIADKLGGAHPTDGGGQVSAVASCTMDHLRDIERTLSRAYDSLIRAENYLG